jgi:hypothetical protein
VTRARHLAILSVIYHHKKPLELACATGMLLVYTLALGNVNSLTLNLMLNYPQPHHLPYEKKFITLKVFVVFLYWELPSCKLCVSFFLLSFLTNLHTYLPTLLGFMCCCMRQITWITEMFYLHSSEFICTFCSSATVQRGAKHSTYPTSKDICNEYCRWPT